MRKALYTFALLSSTLALTTSCTDENDSPAQNPTGVEAPATYTFERNGASSVSYSGQTTRLAMGDELSAALLNFTQTENQLLEMFANTDANGNNVDPFTNPALNASTKSIRSKVAASYLLFNSNAALSAQLKADLETNIRQQVAEIFTARNSAASAGVAGQIADGSAVRYVNAQGFEYNQFLIKSLIGALCADQMLNNYLSPAILDEASNREDNTNGLTASGANYTVMEHKWDEAYGYLFGGASDGANPLTSLGSADEFLNKYLGRVANDPDFANIEVDLFNAFKLGRAAIVASNYALRDEQAARIQEMISEIIGIRAVYYLQAGKNALAANQNGTALHDLSEGYGFIFSLQFTHNPGTGQPYFSNAEVNQMLIDLTSEGPNGFWDLSPERLDGLSQNIANRFSFTIAQAAN
jgi:hypothetical protein